MRHRPVPPPTSLGRRPLLAGLACLLAGRATAASPLRVVASFTILADFLREVGGGRVSVRSLAGPDQELHGFEPRPSDLQAVGAADAMVVNGLGLEGWAERLAGAAGYRGMTIVAARGVPARPAGHAHGAGGGTHNHGGFDPHAWQDVANAKRYVATIRDGLAAADRGIL